MRGKWEHVRALQVPLLLVVSINGPAMKIFLLVVGLLLSGCDAQGKYQIVAAKGSTADEDRVWILDTVTGRVSLCYESAAQIKCLGQSETPKQGN